MRASVPARTTGFQPVLTFARTGWKPVLRGSRLCSRALVDGGRDGAGAVERAAHPAGEVAHVLAGEVHAAVGAVEDGVMRLSPGVVVCCERAAVERLLLPRDRETRAVVLVAILRVKVRALGQCPLDPRCGRKVPQLDRLLRKGVASDDDALLPEVAAGWVHDLADRLIGTRDPREDAVILLPE